MSSQDIDKAYISPYDKFMFEFDATHAKSASQEREINKHAPIFKKRDDKNYQEPKSEIWEEF